MLNGADISNHNWPINPTVIPGEFVILRASEGKGMRDPHFPSYDAKLKPSNKLTGAYHFAFVQQNAAKAEAANFVATIEQHLRPGFLLVLDWEPRHDAHRTDWAVDCALEIKRLTDRAPILYANHSTLDRWHWARWRTEVGTAYWLAGGTGQYDDRTDGYSPGSRPTNPSGWGDALCWQYTECGFLPGWSHRLDLNVFFGTPNDWRTVASGQDAP